MLTLRDMWRQSVTLLGGRRFFASAPPSSSNRSTTIRSKRLIIKSSQSTANINSSNIKHNNGTRNGNAATDDSTSDTVNPEYTVYSFLPDSNSLRLLNIELNKNNKNKKQSASTWSKRAITASFTNVADPGCHYDSNSSSSSSSTHNWIKLSSEAAPLSIVDPPQNGRIPVLSHGLQRVVDVPGLHPMQDFKTQKYNFDPFLCKIHSPEEIAFDRIPSFITSSKDSVLHSLAIQNNCLFAGSTSSVSALMSHIYLILSNYRPLNTSGLSKEYDKLPKNPAPSVLFPVVAFLRQRDGVFFIDMNDKKGLNNGILCDLGISLERMLTLDKHVFTKRLLKSSEYDVNEAIKEDKNSLAYSYLRVQDCLLRSQLDCMHDQSQSQSSTGDGTATSSRRLIFDVKTRSSAAIRYNLDDYEAALPRSRLTKLRGALSSFEREYYDMMRSTFLRFSFQLRIGQMDGALVCYHNTKEMFGFQYVPLSEVDQRVYGSSEFAVKSFDICCKVLSIILRAVTRDSDHGGRVNGDVMMTISNNIKDSLYIYVQPLIGDGQTGCGGAGGQGHRERLEATMGIGGVKPVPIGVEGLKKYRLSLQKILNNRVIQYDEAVMYAPGDDLQVLYCLERVGDVGIEASPEYGTVLRKAGWSPTKLNHTPKH